MKLIVGLGNPGKTYAKTRHNIGFMVIDQLAEILKKEQGFSGLELSSKFNAEMASGAIGSDKVILLKPMTFMNASGQSVELAAHYYRIPPEDVIVVHDDKDLPLGTIRVQKDRGHAGHNGVRSIIEHLGTKDVSRIRVGIAAKDPKRMADVAEFVLGKFSLLEKRAVSDAVGQAVAEVQKLLPH